MKTTGTTRALRVVRAEETLASGAPAEETLASGVVDEELTVEEYWAQVQALRSDLARLRPAN
jgi:hypothetical protein